NRKVLTPSGKKFKTFGFTQQIQRQSLYVIKKILHIDETIVISK
ncbi:hypothetical protein HMPREF1864_01351, partial [Peptoniphilus sp. DNF00840]